MRICCNNQPPLIGPLFSRPSQRKSFNFQAHFTLIALYRMPLIRQFLPLLIFSFVWTSQLAAQRGALSAEIDGRDKADLNLPLYRGKAYHGYPSHYLGRATVPVSGFSSGDIIYQGVHYGNVELMYDAYSQQLIVNHPALLYPAALETSWVSKCQIGEHSFRNISNPELQIDGLLAVLVETPQIDLMKQHRRKLEKRVKKEELQYHLVDHSRYIINYNGKLYEINSKKDFYRMAASHKKPLKKFYKKENLNFKKKPEEALRSLTLFLYQLHSNS